MCEPRHTRAKYKMFACWAPTLRIYSLEGCRRIYRPHLKLSDLSDVADDAARPVAMWPWSMSVVEFAVGQQPGIRGDTENDASSGGRNRPEQHPILIHPSGSPSPPRAI